MATEHYNKEDNDPLIPYLQKTSNLPSHLSHIPHEIATKGYAIVPSLLTKEECQDALDSLWEFVTDVSGGMVRRDDFQTWYPPKELMVENECDGDKNTYDDTDQEDPWPHTGYASFPDMFQSLGAGFVLGATRELIGKRLFEPLFGMKELHASKEGFTFARPTVGMSATSLSDTDDSPTQTRTRWTWRRPVSVTERKVCGKFQPNGLGEHYDQSHGSKGLHTLQSSVAFLDQDMDCNDGHFLCYPHSHSDIHQTVTRDTYRGQFSWVPLTQKELDGVTSNGCNKDRVCNSDNHYQPEHIYAKAGDVIVWRSDLIHAAVLPGPNTPNFRAVGYFSMCPASFTEEKVLREKLNGYKWAMTGDHRSFVESWHEHRRGMNRIKNKVQQKSNGREQVVNWTLERQRPRYRLSPPLVTTRLAELYGLIPYGLKTEDEYKRAKVTALIRGVRFVESKSCEELSHLSSSSHPLCNARTKIITLANGVLLPGQDKYLGGMCSPCGRYVYGVPGHAKKVLRVNTETNEMDFIGPSFDGPFKWLRGVEVPAEVMGDELKEQYPFGCCLALPSNASCVLKINPKTSEVSTFGEMSEKGWLYHGGNLAADGFVYAIPANALQVMRIDPRTDKIEFIGPLYHGVQKWYGGVLAYDGCIYGIPHNATGVLKIDPISGNCTILGALSEGKWKWHGGLAINGGKKIIGFPNNADNVLVVDVEEQRVYTVGCGTIIKSGRHRQDQRYKYLGGAVSQDGKFTYLFPCDAERVLRIENSTLNMKLVGPELLEGENKYQNGFVSSDGCLYGIPQRASSVLKITPSAIIKRLDSKCEFPEDLVDAIHCGDDMIKLKDKFEGGVMDSSGNIYCIPLRAKTLLKVIPGPSFRL